MSIKGLKEYQINIFNLSNKLHEFEFDISNKLFETREFSPIDNGSGKCRVSLLRSETMMNLHFSIEMKVKLTCDRSLDTFFYPISLEEDIIIKYGEDDYSLSEDVFVIRKDSPSINVGDFIYEFAIVAVPMKRLHPRYDGEDLEEQPDIIYTSQDDQADEQADDTDPRWEALKKLKD